MKEGINRGILFGIIIGLIVGSVGGYFFINNTKIPELKGEIVELENKLNSLNETKINIYDVDIFDKKTTFKIKNMAGKELQDLRIKVTIGFAKGLFARISRNITLSNIGGGETRTLEVNIGKNNYPNSIIYLFKIQLRARAGIFYDYRLEIN